MTYATSNPPRLVSQSVGATGGDIWIYKDGDTLGDITVNGYISDAAELGIKAGDKIVHIDETTNVINELVAASWTNGTASGATCSAIEPVGETSIALSSAGTGTILVGDIIKFGNDPDNEYRVTTGDTDVSNGGTLVITPALVTATAVGTTIEVQSDVVNLEGEGKVIALTASRTVLAEESGATFTLAAAAGLTVTLPAPVVGMKFKFVVLTSVTSNDYGIDTDGASTFFTGAINVMGGSASSAFGGDGTADVSINQNGTTTGGLVGSVIELEAISSTVWKAHGTVLGSGTQATPFA